jgi:hypothetical protein
MMPCHMAVRPQGWISIWSVSGLLPVDSLYIVVVQQLGVSHLISELERGCVDSLCFLIGYSDAL